MSGSREGENDGPDEDEERQRWLMYQEGRMNFSAKEAKVARWRCARGRVTMDCYRYVMEIPFWPKSLNSVSNTSNRGSLERIGSMKEKLSITLSKELVEEIDKRRGLIPRSTFLENRLRQKFGLETEE